MSRLVADRLVAAGFAVAGFLVIAAPALAAQWGGLNHGVGSLDDDVLLASTLVGALHAALAWRRLTDEELMAQRRSHVWIAALDALVVLALGASLLLLAVLVAFPDEHFTLGNRGFPGVTLWAAIQLAAILAAELTARLTFRYLEPARNPEADRIP